MSASDLHDRDDLLVRYVLDELDAAERSEFERSLAGDAQLRREVDELCETFAAVGYGVFRQPPSALRERVLRAASPAGEVDARRPRSSQRIPVPRRGRWLQRGVGAAIAASLIGAFALHQADLRREIELLREVNETLNAPNVVVAFDLRGTGEASEAYGKAVLDLDASKAAVVLRKLEVLPDGQRYWLWAMVGDQAIRCGRFDAHPSGEVVRQLAIPVGEYTEPVRKLLVTIESGEPEEPRGPVVMAST